MFYCERKIIRGKVTVMGSRGYGNERDFGGKNIMKGWEGVEEYEKECKEMKVHEEKRRRGCKGMKRSGKG